MSESIGNREQSVHRDGSHGAAEPPSLCSLCAEPIRGTYYRAAQASVCAACRERALAARDRGTPASRFVRAAALGTGAAILGAVVWYAVAVWTDREFGLIAIVIGLLVGGAVRLGCYRRGGWRYQLLAMALTYTAIVSSYVPLMIDAVNEPGLAASDGELTSAGDNEAGSAPASSAVDKLPEPADEEAIALEAAAFRSPEELDAAPPEGLGELLVAFAILLGIVLAAPFLAGFENFMGWVIIAVALYEAWKLNRHEEAVFDGPFHPPGHRSTYVPETPPPPIAP